MVQKKIPMRTCIACRCEKPKRELIRVVKNKEGVFSVDRTGKLSGRGAYVCDCSACMEKVIKKRLLNHAFSQEISEEVYLAVKEAFFGK